MVDRVRTPEGAEKYGKPIGAPIMAIAKLPKGRPAQAVLRTVDSRKGTNTVTTSNTRTGMRTLKKLRPARSPQQNLAEHGGKPTNPVDARLSDKDKTRVIKAAKDKFKRAKANEPAISASLQSVAKDVGGELQRFEFRLKEKDSLARKISEKVADSQQDPDTSKHLTAAQASEQIRDSVRYTVVVPVEGYWQSGNAVRDQMIAAGYTPVKQVSGWNRTTGYLGRNDTYITADGIEFEVQIHTQQSLDAAEANHPLYDVYRLPSTPADEKAKLLEQMDKNLNAVIIPEDTPYKS